MNKLDEILFGGSPLEGDEAIDKTPIEDPKYNAFGDLEGSEEGTEEETEQPQKPSEPKISNELLLQQVLEQNKQLQNMLLQQQNGGNTTFTKDQEQILATGKAVHDLQTNNPMLYNEVLDFLQKKQNGQNVTSNVDEVEELLRSPEYKDIDTKPFLKIIHTIKQTDGLKTRQLGQLAQIVTNLQKKIDALESGRNSDIQRSSEQFKNKVLTTLRKAELDFGIEIDPQSDEGALLITLINKGRDPREAFKKVYGKKEEDAKNNSESKKTVKVSETPNKDGKPVLMPAVEKLSGKLFGSSKTSSSLFQK